jgi:hypothetical protein
MVASLLILLLTCSPADFSTVKADNSDIPMFSMPVEYVNYTIVDVNGVLWAKVDGTYPIHILNNQTALSSFPMFYPVPPGTQNISWAANGKSLSWGSSSGSFHHTAIGDWESVYFWVNDVTDFFVLTTHYEHPLQKFNGNYVFLYDLNINPYLSEESENSDIYYKIAFEVNAENIKAYTTQTDTNWVPINFNNTQNGAISIVQHSKYEAVLGDLVVEFSAPGHVDFPVWIFPAVALTVFVAVLLLLKYGFKVGKLTESKSSI